MGLIKKDLFSKSSLQFTLFVSLIIQIISVPFYLYGLLVPLGVEDVVLSDILKMETVVQIIEAGFYFWYFMTFTTTKDVAKFRYYDWFFTTPTMLLSTIVYFEYKNFKELGLTKGMTLKTFLDDNKKEVLEIVFYNMMMLVFGYLQEVGIMNIYYSTILGFGAFGMVFYKMYSRYVRGNKENIGLFNSMMTIWGLYGVAALMPNISKNTTYNILDLIAKNFYGFFLAYEIYKVKSKL
jgi:bacteriorhodopsin